MIPYIHAQQKNPFQLWRAQSTHQCSHPPAGDHHHTHVLSSRQAELLATLGRIRGKDRDGDGEERRTGREEGRFLYGNMGEGQNGQQRIDGRRSKLQ